MWANNTHSKKLPIPTPGNMWPVVIPGQGRLMLKRETPVLLGNHAPKSNNPRPPNIRLLYDIDTRKWLQRLSRNLSRRTLNPRNQEQLKNKINTAFLLWALEVLQI